MEEMGAASLRTWFPALRRREGARFQLFCFPFAGGGASAYRLWQEQLPRWIELWPLEYPGHETRFREPALDNAADLSRAIAEQIAGEARLPFALFGHSMGALLAFETARALRGGHGLAPARLFVSGYGAPRLKPFRPPMRDLPEAAFREELRRYGGTPEQVLADDDFMQFLSPLLRRDFAVCETYVYTGEPELDIPIVAFGGNDDPTVPWGRLLDWSGHTNASFRAHFMRGQHFFIKEAAALICSLIAQGLESGAGGEQGSAPASWEAHLWAVRGDLEQTEALRSRGLVVVEH